MKSLSQVSFLVAILILLAAWPVTAQEQDADLLGQKIEQLEKTELKSKSSTVQDIYKRSLFRLYKQYVSALEQEFADLKNIQSATSGTNADPQNEIAAQIQKVVNEQNVTAEKIKTLGVNLEASASSQSNATAPDGSAGLTKLNLAVAPTTKAVSTGSETGSRGTAAKAADGTITLCGQIKPASLNQILALVESSPDELVKTAKKMTDKFKHSTLKDNCEPDPNFNVGDQKDAVTAALRELLDELADLDKNPSKRKQITLHSPSLSSISSDTIKREILLLNGYIGNAIVHVEKADGTKYTPRADKDGNYSVEVPAGTYAISTEADFDNTRRTVIINEGDDSVRMDIPIEDRPVSLLTRAIVGYEQAGAAAAKHDQNYFFDLFISKSFPFKQKIDPDFGERLRTWVDFRFATVPQTGDATLGDFTTGFATQVSSLKVKDVARVFEFLGGLEYRLSGNSGLLPSFDRQTKQKFSLSLIAAGGVTTPTNPLESISTFKVTPGAPGLPPQAVGKDFIAFVQSDRDRFFRQYYVGFRMQTFFFNLFNMPMQRFPAQLDVALGQNEFVTGGKLKAPVVRIDGYFPLPYDGLKFINIFGTALLRPGHSVTGIPLVLQPAPDGTVVPAPNVALIALPQPSRDYYRVGFGIDLMSLIQKWSQKK